MPVQVYVEVTGEQPTPAEQERLNKAVKAAAVTWLVDNGRGNETAKVETKPTDD